MTIFHLHVILTIVINTKNGIVKIGHWTRLGKQYIPILPNSINFNL